MNWHKPPSKGGFSMLFYRSKPKETPMMNSQVTGTLYAIDPIFSPDGYALSVFGSMIDRVTYTIEGKKLEFTVMDDIPLESVDMFVNLLIPSISEGRKVEINIVATTK